MGGGGVEALGCVEVDGGVGFGYAEAVGEGVVSERGEPGEVGADAGLHLVAYVGEDAGLDAGSLEAGGPVDHGLIGLGPEGVVGVDECGETGGVERAVQIGGYLTPVSDAAECAAIVGVAVLPIGGLEAGLVDVEDLLHPGARGWIGRSGEDQAVVEEDCVDGEHAASSISPMGFSRRTDWDLGENDLAAAVRRRRGELVDLTVSNPTVCGFDYDEALLLGPLASAEALAYAAEPLGMVSARAAVAGYYSDLGAAVAVERICLTTSTSEAYSFLFRLLCDPGDEVLVARPSYPLFDFLARLDDVALREYPLLWDPHGGWSIDVHALRAAITERTRAVIVVHPNNPTGNFVAESERQELEAICVERGIALIVDEVFLDYALGEPKRSFVVGGSDCLKFVLSGVSKVCGLPQMKASWVVACGPEAVVRPAMERVEVIADTFLSMNAPVQHALPVWLGQRGSIQGQILERMRGNLRALDARLAGTRAQRLGIEAGWTAVLRVPRTGGGVPFVEAALGRGVLVQPGEFYGLPPGRVVVSLLTRPEVWARGLELLPVD